MPRPVPLFLLLFSALISTSANAGQVDRSALDEKTWRGVVRCMQCDPKDAAELGMRITGSEPVFPANFDCRNIDEGWAIDYSTQRARPALHGGIDIPAPRNTPILAVADGEVVAMFDNHETAVGVRIFLRHAPEQTGKPFWVYSEYAHLKELPPLQIGGHVKRGDMVGLTSNTGISGQEARAKAGGLSFGRGKTRRDAIHFSIMYSDSPDYVVLQNHGGHLVPIRARWMDPVTFYRNAPPYDSDVVVALKEDEKKVSIPIQVHNGVTIPPGSKLIWPYSCVPR